MICLCLANDVACKILKANIVAGLWAKLEPPHNEISDKLFVDEAKILQTFTAKVFHDHLISSTKN